LKIRHHDSKISKVPRYDWLRDPKHYLDERGGVPKYRCIHCGCKFLGHLASPFCIVCYTALWLGKPEDMPTHVTGRIRVPDDYNFQTQRIERKD
jgi:hypothetical protein